MVDIAEREGRRQGAEGRRKRLTASRVEKGVGWAKGKARAHRESVMGTLRFAHPTNSQRQIPESRYLRETCSLDFSPQLNSPADS